jgi:hypothetical protein
MRNINRGAAAAVLTVFLTSTPVIGATRSWVSPTGILQSVKRFVVRVASRISPPVGSPTPLDDTTTTTTTTSDPTTRTQ